MPKNLKLPLSFDGGLITTAEPGECLGFLLVAPDRGVFDATYGRVPVTAMQADAHNAALCAALIDGLDRCEIGQGNTFYLSPDGAFVTTWNGRRVAPAQVAGRTVSFDYHGRRFRGRRASGGSAVHFTRIL